MGIRFFEDRKPSWISFTGTWGTKPGNGKWYKRMVAKAQRRFGKLYCRIGERAYRHSGSLVSWLSEIDWRGW